MIHFFNGTEKIMTELLKEIGDIIKQDPNAVDVVRRHLRNTKAKHKEANTRDLNEGFQVPGYKYVKRNNVLYLEKDSGKGKPEATPDAQSTTNLVKRRLRQGLMDADPEETEDGPSEERRNQAADG
jgi:hypothetical protein